MVWDNKTRESGAQTLPQWLLKNNIKWKFLVVALIETIPEKWILTTFLLAGRLQIYNRHFGKLNPYFRMNVEKKVPHSSFSFFFFYSALTLGAAALLIVMPPSLTAGEDCQRCRNTSNPERI